VAGTGRPATAGPRCASHSWTVRSTRVVSEGDWSMISRSTTRIHSNRSGIASAASENRSVWGMTSIPIVLPITCTRFDTARSCRPTESRCGAASSISSEKYSALRFHPAIP
jgi:hypothetical protein